MIEEGGEPARRRDGINAVCWGACAAAMSAAAHTAGRRGGGGGFIVVVAGGCHITSVTKKRRITTLMRGMRCNPLPDRAFAGLVAERKPAFRTATNGTVWCYELESSAGCTCLVESRIGQPVFFLVGVSDSAILSAAFDRLRTDIFHQLGFHTSGCALTCVDGGCSGSRERWCGVCRWR